MSAPSWIPIGDCEAAVIGVGHVTLPLLAEMNVPPGAARDAPQVRALAGQREIPLQCVLIRTPNQVVLVDAGLYDVAPDSPYAIPGYTAPPDLPAQLESLGVGPDDVAHVVITHRHWDHFNGTTRQGGAARVPCFRRARHHLGRADWERVQRGLASEGSLDQRTFGVLQVHGLLDLVDAATDLTPEVRVIPAPGETAGHQIVRLHSGGQTLYAIGDLYHHPVEFLDPTWMVSWADAAANLASRERLLKDAVPERAFLVAGHIPGIGRLEPDGSYTPVLASAGISRG